MTTGQSQPLEHLEIIGREESLRLLEGRGVGRIGGSARCRPIIFPVNYVVDDGAIVFRTSDDGDLAYATDDTIVAFEIDSADFSYHEGWSVLVVGHCTHVSDPAALERLNIPSWAGPERRLVVRIELDEVSGRRISHHVA